MEQAKKLGPLHGPGMSEGRARKGAHGLSTQSAPLPPQAPLLRPYVATRQAIFRAQVSYPQAPPA